MESLMKQNVLWLPVAISTDALMTFPEIPQKT